MLRLAVIFGLMATTIDVGSTLQLMQEKAGFIGKELQNLFDELPQIIGSEIDENMLKELSELSDSSDLREAKQAQDTHTILLYNQVIDTLIGACDIMIRYYPSLEKIINFKKDLQLLREVSNGMWLLQELRVAIENSQSILSILDAYEDQADACKSPLKELAISQASQIFQLSVAEYVYSPAIEKDILLSLKQRFIFEIKDQVILLMMSVNTLIGATIAAASSEEENAKIQISIDSIQEKYRALASWGNFSS